MSRGKIDFDALARIFGKGHKDQFGGFKKAKKAFYAAHQKNASDEGAKRLDLSLWDISSYNKKCKFHCDHGINGYMRVRKDSEGNWVTTPVVCACVAPRRSSNEESTAAGADTAPVSTDKPGDDKVLGHTEPGPENSG